MVKEKISLEKNSEPEIVKEDLAILKLKDYKVEHYLNAVLDLSEHVDNVYFKAPFQRCPGCHKSGSAVMAHFGQGGSNKIGNLKGFDATIGDVIGWSSSSYNGISIVKSKDNGVFMLESEHFSLDRKEPAVIEKLLIPEKFVPILTQMAIYLANAKKYKKTDLVKIGQREYPSVIAEQL